jgi:hypothetical protein
MPAKAKAKKNQDKAEGHPDLPSPTKGEISAACDDPQEIALTAGDLTKSTSADTKPKGGKRAKKNVEEAKQPPAGKKVVKRNRTNLQDAKLIAMCEQLGIDINNIDPNDQELKAILQAACGGEESDKESDSPAPKRKVVAKDAEDEEEFQERGDDMSDSELAKAMKAAGSDEEDSDREESKVAPQKKRDVKKTNKVEDDKKKSKKEVKDAPPVMGGKKAEDKPKNN